MFFKLSRHFNLTAIKSKSRANDLLIRHGNALKLIGIESGGSCGFVAGITVPMKLVLLSLRQCNVEVSQNTTITKLKPIHPPEDSLL